jgi:hypothetical protein
VKKPLTLSLTTAQKPALSRFIDYSIEKAPHIRALVKLFYILTQTFIFSEKVIGRKMRCEE